MSYRGNKRLSVKRKFVADGVFYSEVNELLIRELAEVSFVDAAV
jgi:small subunit ribosomal protein S3e